MICPSQMFSGSTPAPSAEPIPSPQCQRGTDMQTPHIGSPPLGQCTGHFDAQIVKVGGALSLPLKASILPARRFSNPLCSHHPERKHSLPQVPEFTFIQSTVPRRDGARSAGSRKGKASPALWKGSTSRWGRTSCVLEAYQSNFPVKENLILQKARV